MADASIVVHLNTEAVVAQIKAHIDDNLAHFRLVGDEDCGVSLHCRDDRCWLGGQPIAYYGGISAYTDVPEVAQAETIGDLLRVASGHLTERHAGETR